VEKKYNVLVVDDEPEVLAILVALIQATGEEYNVIPAANAFEALKILHQTPIAFAFLDQNMAELSGLELLEHIRQRYQDVQVVIVTGQPSYSLVLSAWRHQAADFLSKPVGLKELQNVLVKLKIEKTVQTPNLTLRHQRCEKELMQGGHGQIGKLTREQRILCEILTSLAEVGQTDELYTKILQMALDLTNGTLAYFLLVDQDHRHLEPIASLGTGDLNPSLLKASRQVVQHQTSVFIKRQKNGDLSQEIERIGLAVPFRVRGELFGVLVVSHNPERNFDADDVLMLNLLAERASLIIENTALYESAVLKHYETLRALVNSLEARDPYSCQHSERVTQIALRFAQELSLPQEDLDAIRIAGLLHDIGKVGIRDAILFKPGKLNQEEQSIIRTHPLVGERIVEPLALLTPEKDIILHHHERWDGQGYPSQLAGKEIPFLSRILALADAYDAITSDRPYRGHRDQKAALTEILANAGSQFDPELTRPFVKIIETPPVSFQASNLLPHPPALRQNIGKLGKSVS